MHSQQPPGVVQNWSTLQCSKQNTEQCGYDHAPVTRGRMRAQFPLPHGRGATVHNTPCTSPTGTKHNTQCTTGNSTQCTARNAQGLGRPWPLHQGRQATLFSVPAAPPPPNPPPTNHPPPRAPDAIADAIAPASRGGTSMPNLANGRASSEET